MAAGAGGRDCWPHCARLNTLPPHTLPPQVLEEMKVAGDAVRGKSKYRGVGWSKQTQKWAARIKISGKDKYVGFFHDEAEAARAYDRALIRRDGRCASCYHLHGPSARSGVSKL